MSCVQDYISWGNAEEGVARVDEGQDVGVFSFFAPSAMAVLLLLEAMQHRDVVTVIIQVYWALRRAHICKFMLICSPQFNLLSSYYTTLFHASLSA